MRPESMCFPGTRDHVHVKIQGSLTKGSAVYCPLLAKALAQLFHDHLQAESKAFEKKNIATEGLESLLVNEIAKKAQWKVSSCWQWKGYSHINVLELASLLQVVKAAARRGGGRTCLLLDSFVALRSTCKGTIWIKSTSAFASQSVGHLHSLCCVPLWSFLSHPLESI